MSSIQPFQRSVCVPVPIVGSERSSQVDDETVPLVGQVVHFGEEVESFRGEREVERGREREGGREFKVWMYTSVRRDGATSMMFL